MHKSPLLFSSLALLLGCGAPAGDADVAALPRSITVDEDGPDISLSERGIFFGQVCRDDVAVRTLVISNVGDARLSISGLSISGTGFSLQNRPELPLRLSPGQRFSLRVEFDPSGARLTPYDGTVRIRSNDPDEDSIDVPVTALALPGSLRVSPREHDFGRVRDGDSPSYSLTLRTDGECSVALDDVRISGRLSHTISIDRLPQRVDAGETERVRVTFECNGEDDDLDASLRFIDTGGRSVGSAYMVGFCRE